MSKMLSYCGINCGECPAYLATQKNDEDEIKKIAHEWSSDTMKFAPEDIYCDGCSSEKRQFKWVANCDIRICCKEKGFENCAHCGSYICDTLKNSLDKDPNATKNLEEIRQNL